MVGMHDKEGIWSTTKCKTLPFLHPHTKGVASRWQEEIKLSHCYSEDNKNNKAVSQAILQSLDGVLQPVLQPITE